MFIKSKSKWLIERRISFNPTNGSFTFYLPNGEEIYFLDEAEFQTMLDAMVTADKVFVGLRRYREEVTSRWI